MNPTDVPPGEHAWKVRVVGISATESRAYARNHRFLVGRQATFHESDAHPSAVELLLGALGGDLIAGWREAAKRAGVVLLGLEVDLGGRLGNPLRHLGVVGESGDAGLAEIRGSLFVQSEADGAELRRLWSEVQERSPLYRTLSRCVSFTIELHITP